MPEEAMGLPSENDVLLLCVTFMSQVLGIVQLSTFSRNRVFAFVFAGEDGALSAKEVMIKDSWESMLAQQIWTKLSWYQAIAVYLSYGDADFQKLALEEKEDPEVVEQRQMAQAQETLGNVPIKSRGLGDQSRSMKLQEQGAPAAQEKRPDVEEPASSTKEEQVAPAVQEKMPDVEEPTSSTKEEEEPVKSGVSVKSSGSKKQAQEEEPVKSGGSVKSSGSKKQLQDPLLAAAAQEEIPDGAEGPTSSKKEEKMPDAEEEVRSFTKEDETPVKPVKSGASARSWRSFGSKKSTKSSGSKK